MLGKYAVKMTLAIFAFAVLIGGALAADWDYPPSPADSYSAPPRRMQLKFTGRNRAKAKNRMVSFRQYIAASRSFAPLAKFRLCKATSMRTGTPAMRAPSHLRSRGG